MILPTGHHILVKPDKVEEKTAGGLYLPTKAREEQQLAVVQGELVAVGPQAWKDLGGGDTRGEAWAKVGDRVYFAKYGGFLVEDEEDGGSQYRLLNDQDLIAVIKPTN